jgi:hypothetical protein
MTTLQEALPCPFCGKQHTLQVISGQELMDENQEFWQHSESFGVVCDASTPDGKGGCGAMGGFKPTEDEAIEAWNTRTALEQHEADKSFQPDWTNYRQGVEDGKAEALAQQGEPMAWAIYDKRGGSKSIHWAEQHTDGNAEMYNAVPLYTAAPAPQAQDALQDIAAYIGVGGYNGATTEQLSERIRVEFDRLAALQSAQPEQGDLT